MRAMLRVAVVCVATWYAEVAGAQSTAEVSLNGLTISLDTQTGGIREMSFADMCFLRANPEKASLLDAAFPHPDFEPLRLGTRYSQGARIDQSSGRIAITWDALGLSRDRTVDGSVKASVTLTSCADGKSIELRATIDNQSQHVIPQVLFPDFRGLQPFAGVDATELRTCGFVRKPFRELKLAEDDGQWYARRRNWLELTSGAYDKSMAARWLDIGSLRGGFSLFPEVWSWGPLNEANEPQTNRVLLHLEQTDDTLRLMCEHRTTIDPGERWTSPVYVLTPHHHGWAKGIEPFRKWVEENAQRPHPLPSHLRSSIGYRTVWMAQQYATGDPEPPTVVWRFRDLPELARESREHGLNEMVLWLWQPWEIPDKPSPELGTESEFAQARDECKKLGVNVSLFVSVMTLLNPIPEKYGWNDGTEYWGYHTDFVPMLRPYYGKASRGAFAKQTDPAWQRDVTVSLLNLIEDGWPSITWDQALHSPSEPNIATIFAKVRAAAREIDPESTFSAECLNNLDLDSQWLDYTWNWALFSDELDWRALVNAYRTPRFNINIGTSPDVVKRMFMDRLFLNVMPSLPDGVNGSAKIEDFPDLSQALQTCARLHATFQVYFEDGTIVGDCILAEPCADYARINAYVLPRRILVMVMNTSGQARALSFKCNVAPWIETPKDHLTVTTYGESAEKQAERTAPDAVWLETTPRMQPGELVLYEIVSNH